MTRKDKKGPPVGQEHSWTKAGTGSSPACGGAPAVGRTGRRTSSSCGDGERPPSTKIVGATAGSRAVSSLRRTVDGSRGRGTTVEIISEEETVEITSPPRQRPPKVKESSSASGKKRGHEQTGPPTSAPTPLGAGQSHRTSPRRTSVTDLRQFWEQEAGAAARDEREQQDSLPGEGEQGQQGRGNEEDHDHVVVHKTAAGDQVNHVKLPESQTQSVEEYFIGSGSETERGKNSAAAPRRGSLSSEDRAPGTPLSTQNYCGPRAGPAAPGAPGEKAFVNDEKSHGEQEGGRGEPDGARDREQDGDAHNHPNKNGAFLLKKLIPPLRLSSDPPDDAGCPTACSSDEEDHASSTSAEDQPQKTDEPPHTAANSPQHRCTCHPRDPPGSRRNVGWAAPFYGTIHDEDSSSGGPTTLSVCVKYPEYQFFHKTTFATLPRT